MHNLIERLRKASYEDTLKGHSIRLVVLVLNSTMVQSVITIIGPIIFSVVISVNGISLSIRWCLLLYTLIIIAFSFVNSYNRRKINDFPLFMHSARLLSGVSHVLAVKNLQLTKYLLESAKGEKPTLGSLRRICSLQSGGFAICEAIYKLFAEDDEDPHLYVTLYQKSLLNGEDVCQMIAYANYQQEEPATYKTPYSLKPVSEKDGKSYFHNVIFNSGSTEIRALPTQEAIRTHFLNHPRNEQREEKLCQYVGIPIMIMGAGTVLLLQLDTNKPDFWGKTEGEIVERIENLVRPFVKMLELLYEHDRLVRTMHSINWRDSNG